MICLIAAYFEAETYAHSQFLAKSEWFFPQDEDHLRRMQNFHVLVVGSAGHNVPSSYFDKIFSLAQQRGRIGREI
jgi:hypothetical protein